MNQPRIDYLTAKYHAGDLSAEEHAEFERMLLSSPLARERFWQSARQHALLSRWGQEQWGHKMAEQLPGENEVEMRPDHRKGFQRRLPTWGRTLWVSAAAACVALVILLIVKSGERSSRTSNGEPGVIAVIDSAIDARWAGDSVSFEPGAALRAGTLRLQSGIARIEMVSGAHLILQAPTEVNLQSEMSVAVKSGRISAYVPAPAHGFRVTGPGIEVVDLGTEFGLSVPEQAAPEVHVFQGRVEAKLLGGSSASVQLDAGQGVVVSRGRLEPAVAGREQFVTDDDFGRLVATDLQDRRKAWLAEVTRMDNDRASLLHLMFESDAEQSRVAANCANGPMASAVGGSIVGCDRVDGRWNSNGAVAFRRPADRIRIDVPGQYQAITLLAWVRVDSLSSPFSSLLVPDAATPGTLRWSISEFGELRLGICRLLDNGAIDWEVVIGPRVIDASRFGQWMLLASTFDGKTVRHYLDGQLVKTLAAASPAPLIIGPAEIGNWRGQYPRFLRGRIDELAILARAMSPQEVQSLYLAGRPVGHATRAQ